MKKYRSRISIIIITVFILNLIPVNITQAMVKNNINIISTTNITKEDAKAWAINKGATETFINLADKYWNYYNKNGQVNPAVAYVQSAIETGYGKFGGVLDETYFNPCGMKTNSGGGDHDANAHHRFKNWDEGVQAHLDHLALYAGAAGYPRKNTFDPRHFVSIKGTATTVLALEGKWASSSGYGKNLLNLYRNLEEFSVKRKKPKMNLEDPSNGLTTDNNTLRVRGWALNGSGVKEVKVYIDNEYIGNANYGLNRPDVNNSYPGYPNGDKSGFAGEFNVSKFSAGTKVIKVEVVGNDGSKTSQSSNINLKRKTAKMNLEDPSNGLITDSNTLKVRGWALNGSGVKEVKLYIDNEYMGNANIGDNRPDVNNAYPGYPNGDKSGFTGEFNVSKFSAGSKVIKAKVIGNDGTITSQISKINLKKKTAKMNLEDPSNGLTTDNNIVKIRGWALNGSGIKEVKIYLDNEYIGNANYGLNRPDVNKAYPGYPNGDKSGFTGEFDLSKFSVGSKVIKAEVIGNDGSKTSQSSNINLKRKTAKMNLEDPSNGLTTDNNTLKVRGWALNGSGVKEIKLYIDGEYIGNANIGDNRPDVNNAYPGYPNGDKSGFTGEFDLSKFSAGSKVIKAEVIGNDGSKASQSSKINLKKKPAKMNLEDPSNALSVEGNELKIRGWALNGFGVKEVKIYIDDEYIGNANIGVNRSDVNNAYPGYPNGDKSGFEGLFNIIKIAPGQRVVKAEVIGNDGSKISQSSKINLKKKSAKINLEDPIEGLKVEENNLKIRGWALNGSGVKEVKIYIDDSYIANAEIGKIRSDVNNAFPGYIDGHKSGFEGNVNVKNLSKGIHKVSVRAFGNDNTNIEMSKWVNIQNKKLIVVDPGHNYGGDYGAEAIHDGIKYSETELSMEVALKLQQKLDKMGYTTVLTRSPFERPMDKLEDSITKRVDLANGLNADLFISLHYDDSTSSDAHGVTTFYSSYKPGLDNDGIKPGKDPNGYDWYDFEMDITPTKEAIKGKELAKIIVDNLSNDGQYYNRKEHDRGLGVTRRTNMPSVLVECGFISNKEEAKKCADPKQQEKVANSIATSIRKLF